MNNGTCPHVDLDSQLRERSKGALWRIAFEFGFTIEDLSEVRNLAWLRALIVHIKDTQSNFPYGKFAMIQALDKLVEDAAKKTVQVYYGNF